MQLNACKQQVLGLTRAARDRREARGGTAVAMAKGLVIHHYGRGTAHPELSKTPSSHSRPPRSVSAALAAHTQAGTTSWEPLFSARASMGPITEKHFVSMRRVMCTAMGDKEWRGPDTIHLLAVGAGNWDQKWSEPNACSSIGRRRRRITTSRPSTGIPWQAQQASWGLTHSCDTPSRRQAFNAKPETAGT